MPNPDFERTLIRLYARARRQWPSPAPLVLLHIGEQQTGVAVGTGETPQAWLGLAVGSDATASQHFKHQPPTTLEFENAIVTVEDEISRAQKLLPAGARLFSGDPVIREIALLSGVAPGNGDMRLSIEAMERSFERLTQVALGQPARSSGLPQDNSFAASLLILREFMHHLQFDEITVLSDGLQTA
jgi:exopolyphosphatase/pppGpp-phosphohydrolase